MRFRDRFVRFMYGRYGLDEMGRVMLYASVLLVLFSTLLRLSPLYYISLIMLVLCYLRIFSKNVYKRAYENDKFLAIKAKVLTAFRRAFCKKNPDGTYSSGCNCYKGDDDRKKYRIFKCPECKQKLRVPRGKGKIQITCRKCGKEFIKRT